MGSVVDGKTLDTERLGVNLSEIPEKAPGTKRVRVDSVSGDGVSPSMKRARKLQLMAGAHYLPKDDPEMPLGQDAHFICSNTIGIADGVGGLMKKGIDSGVYARELMENAYEFVEYESFGTKVDPADVLCYAFDNSTAPGASTVCIVTLVDNVLSAVNLGDSGFMVIREGEVVYRSPVQQSKFNCPYQLGVTTQCKPRHAHWMKFEVNPGDVVVAATDGLFDNLFDTQIEEIVSSSVQAGELPRVIATKLVEEARKVSLCKEGVTPWTVAASMAGVHVEQDETYIGGKYDDITAIVASTC